MKLHHLVIAICFCLFSAQYAFSQTAAPVVETESPQKVKELPVKKAVEPEEKKSITEGAKNSRPYRVKKSVLKEQVDALKTEVISQKTQTLILKDLLKKEGLDGSRRPLLISFKNELSTRYIIDSVTYKLNGELIYQYVADEALDSKPETKIPKKEIETKVVPGPYALEVLIIYRGNDSGVFSYLKDYRITRENKFTLNVKKVNETRVEVQTFESGSLFSDFKDRPQLKISQM